MSIKDRTESVWEEVNLTQFESLHENKSVETCIVGGGITGLSIAYQMAKRGRRVILVEAFGLGSGQTSRTTAHLTSQLESQFIDLLKMHDVETVRLFLEAHRSAIDVIEEIITQENISCDFNRLDGYLFKGNNFDDQKLAEERAAGASCGIKLDYISVTPLLTESIPSLRFPRQGQFNPLKFIQGLVRVMQGLDVEIFEGTHIRDIRQEERGHWTLTTDKQYQIKAENLIVATNTPINNRFHIHTKQFAYRTYAIAFRITSKVKEECLLWDTEDPYHYIRFVGDTIVIGGSDHRTGQEPEEDPFNTLESWSRKKFNFLQEIAWKWSGQIFEPMDQIAFIGRNPGIEKNCYISTGESGIGMTSAIIASLIIPDLIEKGTHPWAAIFDPSRPPTKGMVEYVHENVNVAIQYKDWVTPSEVKDENEIPIDSGSVIREKLLMKTCVYHDNTDHFEKKSAICTHLGGIVHWNDIEKTWDCPCHGSRFNTKGTVIEGPALSDLSES